MQPRALIQSHGRLEKRRSDRPESGKYHSSFDLQMSQHPCRVEAVTRAGSPA